MATIFDQLFGTSQPASLSATQTSQANLPDWYAEYMRGLLRYASESMPTEPELYEGSRIPTLDPESPGYQQLMGSFDPRTQQAWDLVEGNTGTWQPSFQQGLGALNTSVGERALSAAQPYMDQASGRFTDNAASYMSPYTSGVLDEIERRGNRNLTENVLPGVNDQFIASGQFGSGRNDEFRARAIRDSGDNILGQQRMALESGYNQAGQMFNQDQARLAGLGTTTGGIATQDLGRIGQMGSSLANTAGLGQQYGLRDAGALEAIGSQVQQQGQRSADIAYQDFQEQRDWPTRNIGVLNAAVRGLNVPASSTTTQSTYPGQTQASPLSQLAGAGLSMYGLSRALGGTGYARGGLARFSRGGGRPEKPMAQRRPLGLAGYRAAA